MTELAKRLLASIENHGRCAAEGVYDMYPNESQEAVKKALYELKDLGWLRITMKKVNTGPSTFYRTEKNVSRTKKVMYTQQPLFD